MTDQRKEFQDRFALSGQVTSAGKFEVDAITAGEGNGWQFSEETLRESLELWEGVECFVDHAYAWGGRSVRDLGGVFHKPHWCEETHGVRLELATIGPSGELVAELGRQLLAETVEQRPRVGFSADVVFTANKKEVQKILRVISVDLVFNPARGGAFVRAIQSSQLSAISRQLNNGQGGGMMGEDGKMEKLNNDVGMVAVEEELVKLRGVRQELDGYLLETALGAARLPAETEALVRTCFQGRRFEPAELQQAIDQARKQVSAQSGGTVVQGPNGAGGGRGQVTGMFSTEDQLQAAVDDLLGAPRERGAAGWKSHRLSGVKELYMLLTGDRDLFGGYFSERVSLATTANFTGLVKNAMNKIIADQWSQLGAAGYDWWKKVVQVEHFDSLQQVTGILVGTVGALPAVDEGGDYTALKIGDSPETADFTKYGGYIPLTLELIDRDDTRKLRVYPRELAKAGMRKISTLVAEVFTSNSGAGPAMADTGNLFNDTAATTKGGHANLGSTALSADAWEAAKQAMFKQPLLISNETGVYGTGARMAIKPRYLLVPVELDLTAAKILYGDWVNAADIHADNLQRQSAGDVVVVPEWTDATDWAAAADPALAAGIVVGERFGLAPEIFVAGDELSPAVFMNDEHRIKVRHFVAVLVQDFRPLYKANVA